MPVQIQSPSGGGGAGTVTSVSSGNLSPLFTTSVATSTTTPALSFAASNAAAYTSLSNNTGSSAAAAFNSMGFLYKRVAGNGTTYSNGAYADFSNTLTIPSGMMAAGDTFEWGWDAIIYAGNGTPLPFRAGVQLASATSTQIAGNTPSVNDYYHLHVIASAVVQTLTTISYVVQTNDATSTAAIKTVAFNDSSLTSSSLTVSDVSANNLVLHCGGFFNGAQSGGETCTCYAAWVKVYKTNF